MISRINSIHCGLIVAAAVGVLVAGCTLGTGEASLPDTGGEIATAVDQTTAAAATTAVATPTEIVTVEASAPLPETVVINAEFPSERELKLIFRDPEGHKGEVVKVWGEVAYADNYTGKDGFRAWTSFQREPKYWTDFGTATFASDRTALTDYVEDDIFTATVEITGTSSNYDDPVFKILEIAHESAVVVEAQAAPTETVIVQAPAPTQTVIVQQQPAPVVTKYIGNEVGYRTRTNQSANVRYGPGTDNGVVTQLSPGASVTVIGTASGWSSEKQSYVMWSQISSGGWIRSDLLR